ncbi:MAG: hypothetical protein US86_C0007G0092 [Candidatus Daviesbacteria bacterium GW2011_GWA2_38_24]|uniref:EamA domain-containing protein n=1 Tax=Candidatus Daviesbacteria bacterium GW2011_GWA2_38_24 TaxID=1618422 RepID=A0A0G0JH39_9BACT|nr:MAG: hypothetical protein US86_C0007G0092 [Candidatus Daviesbacteria bacterium GW2011_GWA2_38_24]KKQ78097.1 MAG: hypothetical protein UT01_C0078G0002 [Candidatus Daviesbacteria bacterium GW2011_GWA1_38_7]OGE22699.1 MAG: hypothetical protein A2688_02830 [Candidatus Daviesbacteria bacterium RIFCSPHIGHO2_01_FULL_38_8]
MIHLPFTITAYFLNSVAVLIDKFLLTRTIKDPLIYVFYFSIFSLLALVLLPFSKVPTLQVFTLSSAATLLWTAGAYFMLKALQVGITTRVVPLIGVSIPLVLLFFAVFNEYVSGSQIFAVSLLISGLVFLTLHDWKGQITKYELLYEILSVFLFAISYVIFRKAYLMENFLTVFAWSRLVLIPVGVLIALLPSTRHIILARNAPAFRFLSKMGVLFFIGQSAGGSAELLLTFSVSLANPAFVNSLQGVQYVFLFIFALILTKKYPTVFKESFTKKVLTTKAFGLLLIVSGLYFLVK